MNKKILFSGMSILASLTLLTGSALAAFVTTATASGNTFSTTNPSLLVKIEDGTFGTTEPGFTETGITPGSPAVTHNFSLQNSDSDPNATMALTGQLNPTAGDPTLEPDLQVRVTCDNGTDTTYLPLTTWMSGGVSLGNVAPGATTVCTMQVALLSGNTTDANKSITFDAVFSGSVGN